MGACRRVVSALLLFLWAVVGIPLPGSTADRDRDSQATASTVVGSTTGRLRDGDSKAGQATSKSALADDDVDALPPWVTAPSSHRPWSTALALRFEPRPRSTRGSLVGKPRGPPSLV